MTHPHLIALNSGSSVAGVRLWAVSRLEALRISNDLAQCFLSAADGSYWRFFSPGKPTTIVADVPEKAS